MTINYILMVSWDWKVGGLLTSVGLGTPCEPALNLSKRTWSLGEHAKITKITPTLPCVKLNSHLVARHVPQPPSVATPLALAYSHPSCGRRKQQPPLMAPPPSPHAPSHPLLSSRGPPARLPTHPPPTGCLSLASAPCRHTCRMPPGGHVGSHTVYYQCSMP